jgi:hypothetical protein
MQFPISLLTAIIILLKSPIGLILWTVADQKPLHLANSYLHGLIRSSLTGDSHTAMSALYFLDIAYGAESESRVNDVKIMPPKPTKQTPDSKWYFWHDLTARNKVDARLFLYRYPQFIVDHYRCLRLKLIRTDYLYWVIGSQSLVFQSNVRFREQSGH